MEDKFLQELDVKTMLSKIRDSYDLVTHLVNKQYKGLLKFNRSRIIKIDLKSDSENSSSDVSDSDADFELQSKLGVNE